MRSSQAIRFIVLLLLNAATFLRAGEKPASIIPNVPENIPMAALLNLRPEQYADEESSQRTADELERAFPAEGRPEAVKMLLTILRDASMGPREGWFGPAQSRFTWQWLAELHGIDPQRGSIAKDQFRGPDAWRQRLDRNSDGSISAGDLDWSDANPWVQQASVVTRLFRRVNTRGDGRVTRADLDEFFDRAAGGKDHLTVGDLQAAMLAGVGRYLPGDEPSRVVLVKGFLQNELGSFHEGPRLGAPAPDFTLKSADGSAVLQISKLVGPKPLVLVLGNFTCGPFRALYPEVDALAQRYKRDATFLMIYVREAHPTDGWKMESNARANVAVPQPTNIDQRLAVCTQFCERLKPLMPVAVDELNDAAGNAYSGMPARLYVIDRAGLVAFKSGRGPFGFKPGELEQALIMALLDAGPTPTKPD